jgi:molecular chaperone HscB
MQGLPANHFAWFDLPIRFSLTVADLSTAFRAVQTRVHPDRFAAGSEQEKRVAAQWATGANEAYRVLRDPLQRAIYLCELGGAPISGHHANTLDSGFLIQQMEWREALKSLQGAADEAARERLRQEVIAAEEACQTQCTRWLDANPPQVDQAAPVVQQWMFIRKFLSDLA